MPWDDLERNARPVDDVLGGVLARGRHLRWRHRIAVRSVGALAVVICLVGVAAAAASTGGPGHHRVVAATGGPSTSTVPEETSTSSSASTVPAPAATSTTVAVRLRPPATTTTLYCHNSSDPRCGPFRWDTDPGQNAPLTVDVTYTPPHPKAGDTVTFFVTASDPDANQFPAMCENLGDRVGPCIKGIRSSDDPYCGPMYGPWDPPRRPGRESLGNPEGSGVTHTYSNPGTYTATFSFHSAATFCGYDGPYASDGSGSVTFTVDPAEAATTTTTR